MGTLRGHSRPVKNMGPLDKVLDHTYVTCGAGHCWPCWGDCEDGSLLRTGQGSTARADAIAEPDMHAGIIYGVTGMCMQTANRILWPAGVTVSDAMGYEITEFFYGTYGSSAWDWIQHRDASDGVVGEIPECTGTEAPDENPADSAQDAFLSFIFGLYARLAEEEGDTTEPLPNYPLLGSILDARVRETLGPHYPTDRIERLQRIQQECVEEKATLGRSLLARDIRGQDFAMDGNRVINGALRRFAEELGHEAYVALFQMRPFAEITVIRPDICAALYDGEGPAENR